MHVKFSHGVDDNGTILVIHLESRFDIAQQHSFRCLRFHTDVAEPHDHLGGSGVHPVDTVGRGKGGQG